jgi:translocator protein
MFRSIFVYCLISPLTLGFHHAGGIRSNRLIVEKLDGINVMNQPTALMSQHIPKSLTRHQSHKCILFSTTTNTVSDSDSASISNGKFDGTAVLKYGIAITVQMALVTLLFRSMDALVSYSKIQKVPFLLNFILFYGLALKSRIFNPMSNTRPQVKTLETTTMSGSDNASTTTTNNQKGDIATIFKRKMPSWTPPGIVFPIVWLLIIGPIRAATTSMIYATVGSYASLPILSLALHLSIGDVWNTINNVERRFGVAVTGVCCVWLSKAHAAFQYRQVHPMAGALLGATLIWLTIASALVTATWRLNPDRETGKLEPLYPVTGKATTKFAWFSHRS